MKCSYIVAFIVSGVVIWGGIERGLGQSGTTGRKEKPRPSPTRTTAARKDTAKTKPAQEKSLPTIQLKNYVITGKEQVTLPPSEKPSLIPKREVQREVHSEVDEHQSVHPLAIDAIKPVMPFIPPAAGRANDFEFGYGRYADARLSGQIARSYQAHDGILDANFHRTNGFIQDADEAEGKLRLGDAYKFANYATGGLDVQYGYQGYKFYGSPMEHLKRTIQDVTGNARVDIHANKQLSVGLYGGGLLGSIDTEVENKVPAHSLMGGVQILGFAGPHIITASIDASKHSYERFNYYGTVPGNVEVRRLWYQTSSLKFNIGFEGTVRSGLHIRAGGTLYQNEDMVKSKISRAYPYVSISKELPGIGEIFGEFKPEIVSGSLFDLMAINRYLSAYSDVSYVNYPINVHAGWRKRTAQGITWEASYIYKKVEHLGIEVDPFRTGMWSMEYGLSANGFKTTLHGVQFVADWQTSDQVSLWGTVSVLDYSLLENTVGGNIPYHANVTGSATAQFRPGGGFQLELSAKYAGQRYTDLWGTRKLDPYLLANFHIGKRFQKNFEAGISIYNLFNQRFEVRDMYREPDMVSMGVVKFYW